MHILLQFRNFVINIVHPFGKNRITARCPGERYEYEINMLLTAAQSGVPILEEWIETVYLEDNASSHFNPLKDSLKIYMCIFKFAASSLLAFAIARLDRRLK